MQDTILSKQGLKNLKVHSFVHIILTKIFHVPSLPLFYTPQNVVGLFGLSLNNVALGKKGWASRVIRNVTDESLILPFTCHQ